MCVALHHHFKVCIEHHHEMKRRNMQKFGPVFKRPRHSHISVWHNAMEIFLFHEKNAMDAFWQKIIWIDWHIPHAQAAAATDVTWIPHRESESVPGWCLVRDLRSGRLNEHIWLNLTFLPPLQGFPVISFRNRNTLGLRLISEHTWTQGGRGRPPLWRVPKKPTPSP